MAGRADGTGTGRVVARDVWRRAAVVAGALFAMVAALRLAAIAGIHPYVYVDSGEYELLDFTGGAKRPWTVPLLYEAFGPLEARLVVQALVAAAAWTGLALAVAGTVGDRRVAAAAAGTVLALGLTTSVTNWDAAILSESLALSLSAGLLAAWARMVARPSAVAAGAVVALSVLWLFTRQDHLYLLWAVVGAAVLVSARARTGPWLVLAAGLLASALWGQVAYGRNTEARDHNLALVVGTRVAPDRARLDWFEDHGMPVPPFLEPGRATPPEPLEADPAFARWLSHDAPATYAFYLVTHPWYTVTAPLADMLSVRPAYADPPVDVDPLLAPANAYAASRRLLPEPLEAVLFAPGRTGTALALVVGAVAAVAWRWRRAGVEPRHLVPVAAASLAVAGLYLSWHSSTIELGRHALTSAVVLRLACLVLLAQVVDGALADRRAAVGGRR
ncbi:MAG: hypothetical protein ACT4PW_10670 [Acidimicrobiia bacterium]